MLELMLTFGTVLTASRVPVSESYEVKRTRLNNSRLKRTHETGVIYFMNSYSLFSIAHVVRPPLLQRVFAMQETQKPDKKIANLEHQSSTLGLLVTTVEEKVTISTGHPKVKR